MWLVLETVDFSDNWKYLEIITSIFCDLSLMGSQSASFRIHLPRLRWLDVSLTSATTCQVLQLKTHKPLQPVDIVELIFCLKTVSFFIFLHPRTDWQYCWLNRWRCEWLCTHLVIKIWAGAPGWPPIQKWKLFCCGENYRISVCARWRPRRGFSVGFFVILRQPLQLTLPTLSTQGEWTRWSPQWLY